LKTSLSNTNESEAQNNLLGDNILLNQVLIQYFMNCQNLYMYNRGYIDSIKMQTNMLI